MREESSFMMGKWTVDFRGVRALRGFRGFRLHKSFGFRVVLFRV